VCSTDFVFFLLECECIDPIYNLRPFFKYTPVFHLDSTCQCRQLHGGDRFGGKKKNTKRRRRCRSDIFNFAMLFSSNPVNFVKSLRALAECKCDKDCNCQSVMKPSAKSLRSRRRRALSCLKKNAMQMQMVKWKRKLAARSQEAKVRDRTSSRHVPHLTQFSRHIHYS
jgi:hypothetical protein